MLGILLTTIIWIYQFRILDIVSAAVGTLRIDTMMIVGGKSLQAVNRLSFRHLSILVIWRDCFIRTNSSLYYRHGLRTTLTNL